MKSIAIKVAKPNSRLFICYVLPKPILQLQWAFCITCTWLTSIITHIGFCWTKNREGNWDEGNYLFVNIFWSVPSFPLYSYHILLGLFSSSPGKMHSHFSWINITWNLFSCWFWVCIKIPKDSNIFHETL